MTGNELRRARRERGWTEVKAAARLGVSQPYLSLLESGRRPLTARMQRKARAVFGLGPDALPLPENGDWGDPMDPNQLVVELGGLRYPGYEAVGTTTVRNPCEVLLRALAQADLEPRLVEALPWLLLRYRMEWEWLVKHAKLLDLQNRLGFLVTVAREVAELRGEPHRARELAEVEKRLEASKLALEDSFRRASMTQAEQRWLRQHRPNSAMNWNLLTDLAPEQLSYAH